MKITGINSYESYDHVADKKCHRFSTEFDDGWLIICNYDFDLDQPEYFTSLSIGLSSSYFKKLKNLSSKQIEKRVELIKDTIHSRRARYKVFRS